MFRILLVFFISLTVMSLSTGICAESASNPKYRIVYVDFCSGWEFYESSEYAEYRRACFHSVWEEHIAQTDIDLYVQCLEGGTCEEDREYRAWCQTDNPGPDAIQIQNSNRMVVELSPEDCDFSFNSVGTQLSAVSDGSHKITIDFASYHEQWVGLDEKRCMRKSLGGKEVTRSAEIEAVIEGMYVSGGGRIRTVISDHMIENCNN